MRAGDSCGAGRQQARCHRFGTQCCRWAHADLTYQRIGDYPVFVSVGLAEEDYLAPWRLTPECWIGAFFSVRWRAGRCCCISASAATGNTIAAGGLDATRIERASGRLAESDSDLLFELDIDGRYLDYRALNQDLLIVPYPQYPSAVHRGYCWPGGRCGAGGCGSRATKGVAYGTQIWSAGAGEIWFELSVARKVDFSQRQMLVHCAAARY